MPGQRSSKISLAFLRLMATAQTSISQQIQQVIQKEFKPDHFQVIDISGGCGASFEVRNLFLRLI